MYIYLSNTHPYGGPGTRGKCRPLVIQAPAERQIFKLKQQKVKTVLKSTQIIRTSFNQGRFKDVVVLKQYRQPLFISKLLRAPRTSTPLGRLVQRDRHWFCLLHITLVQDSLCKLKECLLDVDVRLHDMEILLFCIHNLEGSAGG